MARYGMVRAVETGSIQEENHARSNRNTERGGLKGDLRELVRQTVEDTLNGLLEEEADDLVGAERYERTADREAYRAGHYYRNLTTSSGEVTIHMPNLRGMRFTTAVIERYRRRETSVEEAMIEMYLAGVSTRRIEDVSEIPWGSSVSAATVSNLNEKTFASVEERRTGRTGEPTLTSTSTASTSRGPTRT